ncbi:MAG: ABC transporter permease [Candidatus Aminicenantes bacterium]|nr:ABC transporter permease [Candidatus Aminicenantes bacterium]
MKPHRLGALFMRHLYLYRRSVPRLVEMFYWPLLDLLVWGFITVYLSQFRQTLPGFVTFFIGALILWDILFRSHQGISVSFLEDIWSKNLLNLFASPLSAMEYISALMLVGLFKLVITATVMTLLAWVFYSFNIFLLGFSLIPFALNLIIMGWTIGIITTAIILRFGQEAEVLAWALGFLFMPISAVFYPVSVLPSFLQTLAKAIPASYVFEGMRGILNSGTFSSAQLLRAFGLNALYISLAFLFFRWNFKVVKKKGLLVRIGE